MCVKIYICETKILELYDSKQELLSDIKNYIVEHFLHNTKNLNFTCNEQHSLKYIKKAYTVQKVDIYNSHL